MPDLQDALHEAAVALEEDIRQIDSGEVEATPARRAFLAGAIRAWKQPRENENGG